MKLPAKVKARLSIISTILILASCKPHIATPGTHDTQASSKPDPESPSDVVYERVPEIIPGSKVFLIERKSLSTDHGMIGFPKGSSANVVTSKGKSIVIEIHGKQIECLASEVTSDPNYAAKVLAETKEQRAIASATVAQTSYAAKKQSDENRVKHETLRRKSVANTEIQKLEQGIQSASQQITTLQKTIEESVAKWQESHYYHTENGTYYKSKRRTISGGGNRYSPENKSRQEKIDVLNRYILDAQKKISELKSSVAEL